MKVKLLLRWLCIHFLMLIIGFSLFVVSFHITLFNSINVFFYKGILILLVVCVVMLSLHIILLKTRFYSGFDYKDIILSLVTLFCFSMVFFTHLPVTADRSVSVFMLGYMTKYENTTFTNDEIRTVFIKKYVDQYGAVQRRFDEQVASGNIIKDGTKYKISNRGKFLIRIYNIIADLFLVDKKFVKP